MHVAKKYWWALLLVGVLALAGHRQVFALFAVSEPGPRATLIVGEPDADPAALKALGEALKDSEAAVRKNAALALGRLGEKSEPAVPALVQALKDPDLDV